MGGRENSDEAYVLDLCDEVLGEQGLRQHRFEWLLGDAGSAGRQTRLPVDSYWPSRKLVVEYRELQHDQATPFFDKPGRLTVSGVDRGEQRALYDARREAEIPARGLRLLVIRPADLDANNRGRLHRRDRARDLEAVRGLLAAAQGTDPASQTSWARDEDRVVDAFRRWLMTEGWTPVAPTDPHTDIEAVRGDQRLVGEAKGRTKERGTDADIAYGQLLRRMTDPSPDTCYALVVPSSSVIHALRVPAQVRSLLGISIYEVADDGSVRIREA
ncbi:hypothetical protein [Peterkaempfera griseoplana]|uniref:hypothetical protein n=1 Tax=Peterkaempfera griseoplana TaxID=66896 RepID=UPI0006E2BE91|nr:hypothetical protein [Peterkaempfera griseoplana]